MFGAALLCAHLTRMMYYVSLGLDASSFAALPALSFLSINLNV
jgi:hypothetical protein